MIRLSCTIYGFSLGGAVLLSLLAAPLHGQEGGGEAEVIERGDQRVEVRVRVHGEDATAICLESAGGVEGRKRLAVSFGEEPVRLSTAGEDRGPHCAFFRPEGETFRVVLEHSRWFVFNTVLAEREYRTDELRGKTLTFHWVRE